MKKKKCITQTYIERDKVVLPEIIRRAKHMAEYPVSVKKILQIAADLPVNKFYISDDAACDYIRKRHVHHIDIKFLSPFKQRLYEALYEEVKKMLASETYKNMTLNSVTILALNRKAPCVGLTPYIIGLRARCKMGIRFRKASKRNCNEQI